MVARSASGKQVAIKLSMDGQALGQIGNNFCVSKSQAGKDKTHNKVVKNPLHGSVAGSGDKIRRNSLCIAPDMSKTPGTKLV